MVQPAVVVQDLVKSYGPRRAVDQLSFGAQPGELLAVLGPNGAGKTTTLEILEGYRRADAGIVRVLGLDPVRNGRQLKPRVGLMLQQGGIYPLARPLEVLRLFSSFYANPLSPDRVLRQVGLESASGTRFRRLSGGQQQRLSLALAIIGRPELLFLDEPTAAMDPQARHGTWDLIRSLKQEGVTIVLTTHSMEEAERLADRVAIIDQGRLLALDTPARLVRGQASTGDASVGLQFQTRAGLDRASLARCLGVSMVREDPPGTYVSAATPSPAQIAELVLWLRNKDVLLTDLHIGGAARTLEDVFLDLTGRELRD